MTQSEIAIYTEESSLLSQAKILAEQLQLPIINKYCTKYEFLLVLTPQRLELHCLTEKIKPIYVDFLNKATVSRLSKSRGRSELIARAVGIKGQYLPSILDTTAGLGGDALILANLGCKVIMLERSPIIAALLEDGLKRARITHPELVANLQLIPTDAKDFLQKRLLSGKKEIDVIYLDPMFPQRTKTALVKKEMRILKKIVGADMDASELFELALKGAEKRVIVKRPRFAETLSNKTPDVVFSGKVMRFDVYFT